jgi:hypothetical protein
MAVEDSLVAILGQSDATVGAGLLISADLVLTCAHVINAALDRGMLAKDRPKAGVRVRRHGHTEVVPATIEPQADGWSPPPAARSGGGDLCILRLPAGTAAVLPVNLRVYANAASREFHAAGFPQDWQGDIDFANGDILGRDQYGLYLLRSLSPAGPKGDRRPAGVIHAGFSGGPVESGGVIVGLVAEARPSSDLTAYMIPASLFPGRFAEQRKEYANRVLELYPHVREYASRMAQQRLSDRTVTFDLRLRFCESFQDVLEAHRTEPAGVSGADPQEYRDGDLRTLEVARMLHTDDANRLLLHAPGGGGKSSFLLELLLSSADENLVPFYLDFSKTSTLDPGTTDGKGQLSKWFDQLEAVGDPDALINLANNPHDNLKPLLVIDSFNQARRRWSEALETITKLSKGALAGASIIVADRMVDRGSAMAPFRHAVIPPLAPSAYQEALQGRSLETIRADPDWRAILASPMFLNLLLLTAPAQGASGKPVPGRMEILSRYFRETCGFTSSDLQVLADFAFEMYEKHRQTTIPKQDLEQFYGGPGKPLQERTEGNGLIHEYGSDAEFRHQILHDSLAALKVASTTESEDETLLRAPAFNTISLNSASDDAIELAVEALCCPGNLLQQRSTPLGPREFLSAVFDWNYWTTLHCVASFDRRGESPLPRWVRHAVYAHTLQRRFDSYLYTALGAEEVRSQIPASPDLSYLDAKTGADMAKAVGETIQRLAEAGAEEEYRHQWLDVYLRDHPFGIDDLAPLWGDPFLSWTASNSIRRFAISPDVTKELVRMYHISRATSDSAPKAAMFRWRLVHTLGRADTAALPELLDAAFDPLESAYVRYGAIWSSVELAATRSDSRERHGALDRIKFGLPRLFPAPQLAFVRRELRRVCAFNEPHVEGRAGWLEEWLGDGLSQFAGILHDGAALADNAGLADEAELWRVWSSAVESVQNDRSDWGNRRSKWQEVLEKDR